MPRKRVGGRFAKEDGERSTPQPEPVGAARPAFSRSRERKRFAQELPAIMTEFTQQAKSGSVVHLRALVELTGLGKAEPPKPAGRRRGKSLEAILREQWRKDDEDEAARAAAKEAEANSQPQPEEPDDIQDDS